MISKQWEEFYFSHEVQLQKNYPGIQFSYFSRDIKDILVNQQDVEKIKHDLLEGVPLAVMMGFSEFYYNKFFVNTDVLIPRPETEYMVDLLVNEFKGKVKNVLDVGTGSGVILLSLLAHGVGQKGEGVDISLAALKVAEINAENLNLKNKVKLYKSDRLTEVNDMFDLIVSNPPYIKAISHRSLVHDSVDKHEPHEALYLPDDYYHFWFEDFFQQVRSQLNGTFMMEGHELELDEQAKILNNLGFQNVQVLNDLTGTKRYLKGMYNP